MREAEKQKQGEMTAWAVHLYEQVQKAQRALDRAEDDLSGFLSLNADKIDRQEYARRTQPESE